MIVLRTMALFIALATTADVYPATNLVTYSAQFAAFAPNAGGQTAFSARRATDNHEWSLFANNYLTTGAVPLTGITYDLRFPICDQHCFWQFYVQTGVGISTAGPMVELLWGTILLWTMRLDFTTQMYVIPNRMIIWSYPLWVGISIPL